MTLSDQQQATLYFARKRRRSRIEQAEIDPTPPVLGTISVNETDDSISFTVDKACTIAWRRNAQAGNPDAATIIAGGGYDSGTFAVSGSGTVEEDIRFAQGNDGLQQISIVGYVVPAQPSNVERADITIDTVAPSISSTSPTDNATDVAITVDPSITFDAAVAFGTGNITLYNVTGSSVVETFDVATDVGTAPGQVNISGATLTIYPTADLSNSVEYAIQIDATAIDDLAGNSFAGIADTTTVSFTTVASASMAIRQAVASGYGGFDTSPTFTLPTGRQIGDILVAVMRVDGGRTLTPASGWQSKGFTDAAVDRVEMFVRTVDGSEGATETFTANSATQAATYCALVAGVDKDSIEWTTIVNSSDSPSHTTSWGGGQDTVYIAIESAERGTHTITGYPAGYGHTDYAASNPGSSSSVNMTLGGCAKVGVAGTEDPGAFTVAGTNNRLSATIALRA